MPFWPLIKEIQVSGNFENIPYGIELSDVPGLDDPVRFREDLARTALEEADYVAHVCDISRPSDQQMSLWRQLERQGLRNFILLLFYNLLNSRI